MNRTNIEWTDFSWNPIRGLCPVDCKLPDGRSYCYARRMYKRFGKKIQYGDLGGLIFHPASRVIDAPVRLKKPSKIFVCSTVELFHSKIPKGWRNGIFRVIKDSPQHIFQILTKFPQNIDRPMPDNVWLGVTMTNWLNGDLQRISDLRMIESQIKFISLEPLMDDFSELNLRNIDWVIIGRLTGFGHKYDPPVNWINEMVNNCRDYKKPVFLKNNLEEIWGEPLIQEMPKEGK